MEGSVCKGRDWCFDACNVIQYFPGQWRITTENMLSHLESIISVFLCAKRLDTFSIWYYDHSANPHTCSSLKAL